MAAPTAVLVSLRRARDDDTSTRLYPTALAGCYVKTAPHWDKDACLAMIAVGEQVSSADWCDDAPAEERDDVRGYFTLHHLVDGAPFRIAMLPGTVIIYASGQVCHGKERVPHSTAPQINSTMYVQRRFAGNITLAAKRALLALDDGTITAAGTWEVRTAKKTHVALTSLPPSTRAARLAARAARSEAST